MIIATAGHVDHGKTTLIHTLTGVDTDRLEIEKQRGLSIELGFAYWNADNGQRIGFVDVPGHARFLPTMAAGVGGIDAALLVIAADDGIMPQTLEHIAVLEFLGIRQGIVAVSKSDRVTQDRIDTVTSEITAMIAETGLAGAPVLSIDSLSGHGFDILRRALSTLQPKCRQPDAPARLSVDRSFILKGVGLVATGTLLSGEITVGDTLTVSPAGRPARIRGLHAQNEKVETAGAGQRCAVNLTGTDINSTIVKRGSWLVKNAGRSKTTRLDTEIHLHPTGPRIKRQDLPVTLHIGAAKITARLVLLDCKVLEPGETALAQLITDEPVDAVCNDRFILRDHAGAHTIAGGHVLTPYGVVRGRAKPIRLQQLAARNQDDAGASLRALLNIPPYCIDAEIFCTERNLQPSTVTENTAQITGIRVTHGDTTFFVNPHWWEKWSTTITKMLSSHHAQSPHLAGCTEKDIQKAFTDDGPVKEILKTLLSSLLENGAIVYRNGMYSLAGFSPALAPDEEALWQEVKARLEEAGPQAPTIHEIAKDLSIAPERLAHVLDRVAAMASVVHISKNRYLLPQTVTDFQDVVTSLGGKKPEGFPVTAFRDQTGIGRNLAIDVLEYMDRHGITVRHGNLRTTR